MAQNLPPLKQGSQFYIITGVSQGLGEALAQEALKKGHSVAGISRRSSPQLDVWLGRGYSFYPQDLTQIGDLDALLEGILKTVQAERAQGVTLINNAASLDPIRPLDRVAPQELEKHLALNLLAPMVLSSTFLRETASFSAALTLVQITSGAALRGKAGWSAYCASKAALNRLTECLGEEQRGRPQPVRVVAVDPGIMDTPMQEKIRSASPEDFPLVPRFKEYYDRNQLVSPQLIAQGVFKAIEAEGVPNGSVVEAAKYL